MRRGGAIGGRGRRGRGLDAGANGATRRGEAGPPPGDAPAPRGAEAELQHLERTRRRAQRPGHPRAPRSRQLPG